MSADQKITRGMLLWTLLLALAGALAATAGLTWYAHYGSVLLVQGDNGVSRLFVGEAERLGAAGFPEQALVLYDKAFHAGFGHAPDKSRALTLKGLLLWREGRERDAAEALSAAVSGSAPNFDGAQALVEALLHLKRVDEAQSVVGRWREALKEGAAPQARADLLYSAGRVAQERGDLKGARAAYEESAALVQGGLADYRIGALCVDAGKFAEAGRHLQRFLLGGASGPEAARARELNRSITAAPAVSK